MLHERCKLLVVRDDVRLVVAQAVDKFHHVVACIQFAVLVLERGALAGGLQLRLEFAEHLVVHFLFADGHLLGVAERLTHPLGWVATRCLLLEHRLLHVLQLLALRNSELHLQCHNLVLGRLTLHVFAVHAVEAVVLFCVLLIDLLLEEFACELC